MHEPSSSLSRTSIPGLDPTPAGPKPGLRQRLITAGLIVAGWATYALMTAFIAWTYHGATNPPHPSFRRVLLVQSVAPVVWIVLTPLILWAADHWRLARGRWAGALLRHLGLAVAVHIAVAMVERVTWTWLTGRPELPLEAALVNGLVFRLFLYGAIVSVAQAAYHHRRYVEGRTHALALRAELMEARARTLGMQLEPHFLYNTLHAISELVHRDPALADEAIMRLADLLRRTTALGGRTQIPLREEIALLRGYADLLHLRWGDGLRIEVDAAGDTLDLAVPPLLLQPLVENAVRHGIRGRETGRIRVLARRENGQVVLDVDDDGVGLPAGPVREGIGLRNTRLRLDHLYGAPATLGFGPSPLGGARLRLALPALAAGDAGPVT